MGLRFQRRIRKISGLPSALKLKSKIFNVMFRVCMIPPNMTNTVVMLLISAEGNLLLQEVSPDLPGSLWAMLSNTVDSSFTALLSTAIKYGLI